jgi:hypothetical protein
MCKLTFSDDVYHVTSITDFRPLSEFPSNPYYPPNTVRIAKGLLCVPHVDITKRQLTTFTFIYSLLSTPNHIYYPDQKLQNIYIFHIS